MKSNKFTIVQMTQRGLLPSATFPVLTYKFIYPRFIANAPSKVQTINQFYAGQILDFYHNVSTTVQDYLESGSPLPPTYPYEAISEYKNPFLNDHIASIYTDQYQYLGGAHGNTIRTSQTWDLHTGKQIPFTAFFPDESAVKAQIFAQIEQQIKADNNIYFDNYKELVEKYFRPENYYLTPDGVVIYFQQYDIGPYVSGIIEFQLKC